MRAVFRKPALFLGLLVCSWAGVLHAYLVSPSMLHHGPLLTQVALEGGSEVYHIYSVTYATAWSREFCVMAASASAHGFRLNLLGEVSASAGRKRREARQAHLDRGGYLHKLWALRDFAVGVGSATPDDMRNRTLILFFDGYDVPVNGTPRTLVKRPVHKKLDPRRSGKASCTRCPRARA
jgi:hypothetical protein